MTWITLPTLGRHGRLGNQLWQIAAGLSHARRHDAELRLPRWQYAADVPRLGALDFVSYHDEAAAFATWSEPSWNFAGLPPFWDGIGLHGYFQALAYWDDRELIRHVLTPVHVPGPTAGYCSIHVRRGDYLRLPAHHPIPPREWYRRAMDLARAAGAREFVICSDDIEWCRREFPGHEVSHLSATCDLALMARCQFNVIANSSLSWWGAFLGGEGRTVIAPAQWFGPALAGHDVSQLDPHEGWTWL